MKPISENIDYLLRRILIKKDPILAEIMINWAKIVGLKFSSHTSPFKISKGREKSNNINVLHVKVTNSSLSMELSFQQDIIIERMSVYLGFKPVSKLKLIIA